MPTSSPLTTPRATRDKKRFRHNYIYLNKDASLSRADAPGAGSWTTKGKGNGDEAQAKRTEPGRVPGGAGSGRLCRLCRHETVPHVPGVLLGAVGDEGPGQRAGRGGHGSGQGPGPVLPSPVHQLFREREAAERDWCEPAAERPRQWPDFDAETKVENCSRLCVDKKP